MDRMRIPLFPLHTVLFPGGPLALRIFEPRYLDMISRCLKEESGFGICLIREGDEVGEVAQPYEIGTLGRISYFNRRSDGLLGITVQGEQRFRILSTEEQPDRLLVAEVELLPQVASVPLPPHYQQLMQLLSSIIEQLDYPHRSMETHYEDAEWVSARLAELLPIPLEQKQLLLVLNDALERLERLERIIASGMSR
jgi:Lon protease-like protein